MKRKAQIISRPTTRARRVVVALRMAGIAGQDKLNGVFEYLSEGRRWQLGIYRTRHEFTAETVHRELENGAEGFIVGIPETDDAFAALAQTHVPAVMMNVEGGGLENRAQSLAIVRSDAEAVGREAATALLRQGVYKCYGYAGYRTDEDWSRERGRAFRDTLEKAAGAMAHYGNNALNIMRNQAEYCGELVEDIDNNLSRALRLSRELRAEFHEDSRGQRLALELEKILARADLTELAGHLGGVLEGPRRMTRIIGSLKKSAERPSLIRYALGQDVLKLEDDSHD